MRQTPCSFAGRDVDRCADLPVRVTCHQTVGVSMSDKRYLIRLKSPRRTLHVVIAASVAIHSDHVAFLNSKGELMFLVMLEAVESWTEDELRC